jgi:hypothetical protein
VTVSAINDPSAQTATRSATQPTSAIDLTWAQNAESKPVMIVRKLASSSWTEPTQGTAYAVDAVLGAGTVVYVGSDVAATASGLADDTTYDFKFYSVNNDYYSAGVVAQASTAPANTAAPTALRADSHELRGFRREWNRRGRATGYRLDVSESEEFGTPIAATDFSSRIRRRREQREVRRNLQRHRRQRDLSIYP